MQEPATLAIVALTLRVGLLSTLLCLPLALLVGYGLARRMLPLPSLLRFEFLQAVRLVFDQLFDIIFGWHLIFGHLVSLDHKNY